MKLLASILLLAVVVCSHAQIRTITVLSSTTDQKIDVNTAAGDEHYIYISDVVKPLNKLFVFLPGTGGRGKNPRYIVPFAATLGYHAISLTYCSDVALAQVCKNDADNECFDKGRQEIIFGDDASPAWHVNKPNSIENRLKKLLQYLAKTYPKDNWSQFLTNQNEIDWSRICLAGQSQGGGHAAYMAQKLKMDRVVMFGSPKDYSDYFHHPANWISNKSVTPLDRYYGFVHTLDETNGCSWAEQKEIFSKMGFDALGAWVNVDGSDPKTFNHSHTLTSLKPQGFAHGAVIADTTYRPAWKYLLLGQ